MISSSFPPIPPKEWATIYQPHDFICVTLCFIYYPYMQAAYTSHIVFCTNDKTTIGCSTGCCLCGLKEGEVEVHGSAKNYCELTQVLYIACHAKLIIYYIYTKLISCNITIYKVITL